MQPPFILSLPLSDSLDDVEPHLSSLRWHRALPKDEREKWDKRAERERQREKEGEVEGRCAYRDSVSVSSVYCQH